MKQTEAPVVVEEIFDAPIRRVWKAISNLEEMKLWYFDNIDAFKAEVGSMSKFEVHSGERIFTHLWEVTEVNAPNKIVYNWKYEEYTGHSYVEFELEEQDSKTKLTLTATVVEDFDDNIPEFKRESCLRGWQYFICWRLLEYLKG